MKTAKKVLPAAVALALAGMAGVAGAGGLAIGTQSGSGTGNAFAGGAAAVEDASTIWYNPAGMTALPVGVSSPSHPHIFLLSLENVERAS